MTVTQRLDAFQQRHRWAGFPLAVVYKFGEDQGPFLAALITYYGFLSLFPLLLLLASVLGFVLQSDAELQQRILDSTLRQFPVIGGELATPQGLSGSTVGVVVGLVVALYGAVGVAQALQNAVNVAWAVPRHRRLDPLRARVRSLLLVSIGGVAVLVTTVLLALGTTGGVFGIDLGAWSVAPIAIAASALTTSVLIVVFRICAPSPTTPRALLPGAAVAAVIWHLLQLFGTAYIGYVVRGAGDTYGVFALVLGLLAWIFLAAFGVVLGVEINVVRIERLYPRSLMTPFTDNVDLTAADRDVYTANAQAQRAKGFQSVTVRFDDEGQQASARRRAAATTSEPAADPDSDEPPP